MAGDYNADGVVNAADYVVWRGSLGQTGVNLPADGNGNEKIDAGDFDVWRANFGQSAAIRSAAQFSLPEPYTNVVLVIVISALFGRGYR